MWWGVIKSDDLRKDFRIKKPWSARFVTWVANTAARLFGEPGGFVIPAGYMPKTGEAAVYLEDLKEYQKIMGGTYKEIISQLLTHEYVHKILTEDPEINQLLKPYRKHIFDSDAVAAQEWATNQMSTTSELQALYNLLNHPQVPKSTKIRAEEKIDRVYTIKEKIEDEAETFLQENPVEEQ